MNRKTIKAAVDAIILLRYAENEVAPSAASNQAQTTETNRNMGGVVDVPINGGGPNLLFKPGLTNQEIFGDSMLALYAADNADPIGKIKSIAEQQAKLLFGRVPANLTKKQADLLAKKMEGPLKEYINSFGTILSKLNLEGL
jgi:hypothetical protein